MKIVALQNKSQEREECCAKTKIQWLITSEIEAKNTLRLFKMGSGGHSLLHKHAWEHIVFVLDGEGLIFNGEKTRLIKTGDSCVRCSKRVASIPEQKPKNTNVSLYRTLHCRINRLLS